MVHDSTIFDTIKGKYFNCPSNQHSSVVVLFGALSCKINVSKLMISLPSILYVSLITSGELSLNFGPSSSSSTRSRLMHYNRWSSQLTMAPSEVKPLSANIKLSKLVSSLPLVYSDVVPVQVVPKGMVSVTQYPGRVFAPNSLRRVGGALQLPSQVLLLVRVVELHS